MQGAKREVYFQFAVPVQNQNKKQKKFSEKNGQLISLCTKGAVYF